MRGTSPNPTSRAPDLNCDNGDALRRARLFGILLVVSLWWVALLAAPSSAAPRLSAMIYAAGSFICHQQPERSFRRDGAQYPVCARCLGLYTGGVAGVLAWLAFAGSGAVARPRASRLALPRIRSLLIITAAPTVLTVLTATMGWGDASNSVRAALAAPLGAMISAVVAAVGAGDLG